MRETRFNSTSRRARLIRALGAFASRIPCLEGVITMALLESPEAAGAYKAKILSYQAGADFLALQAEAPNKLVSLIAGLSAVELAHRPTPKKWSIQEIVAHLADDELVGGYRLRRILSLPGTTIEAF